MEVNADADEDPADQVGVPRQRVDRSDQKENDQSDLIEIAEQEELQVLEDALPILSQREVLAVPALDVLLVDSFLQQEVLVVHNHSEQRHEVQHQLVVTELL